MNAITTEGRLWRRPFAIALAVSTLVGLSHTMLMAVLPGYVMRLGGGAQEAGLTLGIFSFAALIVRPLFGRMLDTVGRRAVLGIGGLLFLGSAVALYWAGAVWSIILIRAFMGFGFSAVTTATGVIITDLSPPRRLAEGLGWLQIANSFTMATGPLAGLILVAAAGVAVFFPIVAAVSGVGFVCALLVAYPGSKPSPKPDEKWVDVRGEFADEGLTGAVLIEPPVVPPPSLAGTGIYSIAAVSFFMALGLGSLFSFVPLFGNSLGLATTNWFFPAYAVASVTTVRCLGGTMVRRFGPVKLALAGFGLASGAFVVLSQARSEALFLGAALLVGGGMGLSLTMTSTILMSTAPVDRRGLSNAINAAAMDIGVGSGSILGGFLTLNLGYPGLFLTSAGTSVAAFITLLIRSAHWRNTHEHHRDHF